MRFCFTYIDIDREVGGQFFKENANTLPTCHDYYSEHVIKRIFNEAGLTKYQTHPFHANMFIIFEKPHK